MAKIDFKYEYPYCYNSDKAKYGYSWSDTQMRMNGNNTYPMVFNNTVPKCSHIEIDIEIENTGSGTVFGITWDFQVYRRNYGWTTIKSFTLPSDGKYTISENLNNYNITQFAFAPHNQQSSNKTWSNWYSVRKLVLTESIEPEELETDKFQYGVFANKYGVSKELTEVYVNIDGVMKQPSAILVNIDGELISLPPVHSAYMKTTTETMNLYKFIPSASGLYCVKNNKISGDHEIRLYDSDFTPLYDGYFYDKKFDLTENTVYYITLTHYYNADESESYLQIYKED